MHARRLLTTLLIIIITCFAADRVGGWVMQRLGARSGNLTSKKLALIESGVDADIVLMGTSRTLGHYIPDIVSDSVGGKRVYNAGIHSTDNIFSQFIALRLLLRHSTPEVICLELHNPYILEDGDRFHTVSFFAPYIGVDAAIDSVFRLAGTYGRYQLSHLYRYNSKSLEILTGQIVDKWHEMRDGYFPNYGTDATIIDSEPPQWPEEEQVVDSLKLHYLYKYLQLCRQHDIRVVFTISPCYGKICAEHFQKLHHIAATFDIPLLDYHTTGLFHDHPEYFHDSFHLNDDGAQAYSRIFGHDLAAILQN